MNVSLETNGWVTDANIKVIGGNRPSIIGRDLKPNLGLQIVQRTPEEKAMSVQEEQPGAETTGEEDSLDPWQTYFIPKKRAPGQIAAPSTPWDLKKNLLAN